MLWNSICDGWRHRAHLRLEGVVTEVSPATFHDEKTNQNYYTARIGVSEEELRTQAMLQMQPGMLVEVEIMGGARSPLRYFFDPISQSFTRAFKEE